MFSFNFHPMVLDLQFTSSEPLMMLSDLGDYQHWDAWSGLLVLWLLVGLGQWEVLAGDVRLGGERYRCFLFWVFYWGALYMLFCLRPQLLYCNNPFFCWVTVMTFSPWLYQPKKGSGVMFLLAPGYYMSLMCPLNLNPACTFVLVSSFGFLQSLFMGAPPVPSHTWTVSQFLFWELIPPSFVLLV